MPAFVDLSGKKFGRWTAIKRVDNAKSHHTIWLCKCECGIERGVSASNLNKGTSISCGCYMVDHPGRTTHGQRARNTQEYNSWCSAIARCYNENEKAYPNYGGRGITMCEDWRKDFASFYRDMGNKPTPQHSLDRIEVNGNYEPSNCKWSTNSEQVYNQRTKVTNTSGVKGVKKSGNRWVAQIGINKKRIHLGYYSEFEDAVKARQEAEIKYYG